MGVITDCFQADYVARRHGAVGLDVGGPASSGDERPHLRTRERFLVLSDQPRRVVSHELLNTRNVTRRP